MHAVTAPPPPPPQAEPKPSSYHEALFESWDVSLPLSLRAAASGQPRTIAAWFKEADSVRVRDSRGWQVTHVAVSSGSLSGLRAVIAGLRSRLDVEFQDELDAVTFAGVSALHMAFSRQRYDLAKELLEAGARPNLSLCTQENELSLLFQVGPRC